MSETPYRLTKVISQNDTRRTAQVVIITKNYKGVKESETRHLVWDGQDGCFRDSAGRAVPLR